jgi:hypothetical protein
VVSVLNITNIVNHYLQRVSFGSLPRFREISILGQFLKLAGRMSFGVSTPLADSEPINDYQSATTTISLTQPIRAETPSEEQRPCNQTGQNTSIIIGEQPGRGDSPAFWYSRRGRAAAYLNHRQYRL